MSGIDQARYMLTLCYRCLGCNKLESEEFKGVNQCNEFRRGLINAK